MQVVNGWCDEGEDGERGIEKIGQGGRMVEGEYTRVELNRYLRDI